MRIHLIAPGNKMPDWVETGVSEYSRRLTGDIRLHIDDLPLPKRKGGSVQSWKAEEAELIRKRLTKLPGAHLVALEVKGKKISTEDLAVELGKLRDLGQDLALLVGGPDGLDETLSASCHAQWSLSNLTLPHPLVRVLLSEQVYRAWSILTGHPYHRA